MSKANGENGAKNENGGSLSHLLDPHGDPLAEPNGSGAAEASPADGSANAAPAATPGGGGGGDGGSSFLPMGMLIGLLLTIKRYGLVALVLFVVMSGCSAFVVHKKFKPTYRAEAVLSVDPIMPRILYTGEEWRANSIHAFYMNYMRTLTHFVVERPVIERAIDELEKQGVAWRPEGLADENVVAHLRSRIEVDHIRDTHLLQLGFEDGGYEVVAPVLNAVTAEFLARLQEEGAVESHAKFKSLTSARDRITSELADVYGQLDGLSERIGSAVLDERQNIFIGRIQALDTGVTKTALHRAEALGQLENARRRATELRGPLPEGLILSQVDEDPALRDSRIAFARLLAELDTGTSGLKPGHPTRAHALERIVTAQAKLKSLEDETRARVETRLRHVRSEEADAVVRQAEREYEAALRSDEAMQAEMADARGKLTDYGRAMFEGSKLRTRVARLLQDLDTIDGRIEELRIESRAPVRVALRSPAIEPTTSASDRSGLFTVVGVVACGGICVVLLLALSQLAPLVYHSDDVERSGLRVLTLTNDPSDSCAAARAVLALQRDGVSKDGLSTIVVPASRADNDAARSVADTLLAYVAESRTAFMLRLAGDAAIDRHPTYGLPYHCPNGDGLLRFGPMGEPEQLPTVLGDATFREAFARATSDFDVGIVAAPAVEGHDPTWPFFTMGYRVVLVVSIGHTPMRDLRGAVAAISRGGGEVSGVILVRPDVSAEQLTA